MRRTKTKGIMVFRHDEIAPILQQIKSLTIRPTQGGVIRKGSLYEAKIEPWSTYTFGILEIENVIVKKLKEITSADVSKDGYLSLKLLRQRWERTYGRWNPEQLVRFISFRLVSHTEGA